MNSWFDCHRDQERSGLCHLRHKINVAYFDIRSRARIGREVNSHPGAGLLCGGRVANPSDSASLEVRWRFGVGHQPIQKVAAIYDWFLVSRSVLEMPDKTPNRSALLNILASIDSV